MARTNRERVLEYLRSVAPKRVTNSEIRDAIDATSHQLVYQITRDLRQDRLINSSRRGRTWVFWVDQSPTDQVAPALHQAQQTSDTADEDLTPYAFEELARSVMSMHFGLPLVSGEIPGVPKKFDMVSADHDVVGDAKYYTLVRGKRLPPAKFSVIAEHVWLLEKTDASNTFLVFGNQRKVPELWLERYGDLVSSVGFYFLGDDGELERLK